MEKLLDRLLGKWASRKLTVALVTILTTLNSQVRASVKTAAVAAIGAVYVAAQAYLDGKQ